MSLYFFHVFDGKAVLDPEGVDLPDMDAVREEAVRASGGILSNEGYNWKGNAWRMIVSDENGTIVFSTSFLLDRHGQ